MNASMALPPITALSTGGSSVANWLSMSVDGTEVSTGVGTACLGDPIEAVVWLARTARELGQPLKAGQVILSGALGPMASVSAGSTVSVTVSGLGTVTARFVEGKQA